MIEFFPPDARLYTDGRIWRWIMVNGNRDGEPTGIACHRSRSLLIATLSLWRWVRKARRGAPLEPVVEIRVLAPANPTHDEAETNQP